MQNVLCEGRLWVASPDRNDSFEKMMHESAKAYQRAVCRYDSLTLVGTGAGSALCIMLAERFAPDALILAPFVNGEGADFFRLMRMCAKNLFAVCAPVQVFVGRGADRRDMRRLQRLLGAMHTREKEVNVLEGDRDVLLKMRTLFT